MMQNWRTFSPIHAGIALSLLLHALVLAWSPPWAHRSQRVLPSFLEVHLASEARAPSPEPLVRPVREPRSAVPLAPVPAPVMTSAAPAPSTAAVLPAAPLPQTAAVASEAAMPAAPQPVILPDLRAAYLANPRPSYPLVARRLGLEGKVILRVEILENGSVAQVQLARGSGHDLLDQSALQAVKQWRFAPARRGGESVAAWVEVPISFRLQEANI